MKISNMETINDCKSTLAMVGLHLSFTGVNLFSRAHLPTPTGFMVILFYRQVIATLIIVSIALLSRTRREKFFKSSLGLGLKGFGWVLLLASFLSFTVTQDIYTLGLYLTSSAMASAMIKLVTLMATIFGLEKIRTETLPSYDKILGAIICVSGAIFISLLEGPTLITKRLPPSKSLFSLGGENLLVGCLILFHSTILWSICHLFKVPVTASCPDYLSSTVWICLFSALHSGVMALVVDRKLEAWSFYSNQELACCFYTGILTAGSLYLQASNITESGPLYTAMYQPLATVFVALFAAIFLHQETYTGSLVGAFALLIGSYVFLWREAKDYLEDIKQETDSKLLESQTNVAEVVIELESSDKNCRNDL